MDKLPKLRRRYFVAATLATLTTVAALALSGCGEQKLSFNATDITGAPFARTLALNDHTGKPRTLPDFAGKVTLISFGFTSCPDYCPATLALWAEAMKRLGPAEAAKVQGLFVTVDPERDTPELLSKYVPAFHPSFLGLYGNAEQTKATASEFKVVFQKAKGATPETYTVDHSTMTYVFDAQGKVRLMVAHGMAVDKLVADLKTLLK
jgi:protein SCO1